MTVRFRELEEFWRTAPRFDCLSKAAAGGPLVAVPPDWVVFATDVVDSTRAVSAGRARDVNLVGAAGLAAVANELGTLYFPFVFGGDGASLVVPPSAASPVRSALLGVRELAIEQFGMELRVCEVPVGELIALGSSLAVGVLDNGEGLVQAVFGGDGFTVMDSLIRAQGRRFASRGVASPPNLKGLSCRWREVEGSGRCFLTVIIATQGPASVYQEFFDEIARIGGSLLQMHPIQSSTMSYRTLVDLVGSERHYHRRIWEPAWWARLAEIVAAVGIFKLGLPPVFFNARAYRDSMRPHSDFGKFDGKLRMVLGCTHLEAARLEAWLAQAEFEGKLLYGSHVSDRAIMTCLVHGLDVGEHLHFVDGASGGYTLAARRLKQAAAGQTRKTEVPEFTAMRNGAEK